MDIATIPIAEKNGKSRKRFYSNQLFPLEMLNNLISITRISFSSQQFVPEDVDLPSLRVGCDSDYDHCFHYFTAMRVCDREDLEWIKDESFISEKDIADCSFEEFATAFLNLAKYETWNIYEPHDKYSGPGFQRPTTNTVLEAIAEFCSREESAPGSN